MTSTDLFENQRELSERIKKIGINIRKDGWDRKNLEYFKKRMQMLETNWGEFQYNHDRLSTEESRSHIYFTSNFYNDTYAVYKEVKELINQQYQQLSMQQQSSSEREPTKPKVGALSSSGLGKASQGSDGEDESQRSRSADDENPPPPQQPPRQEQQQTNTQKRDAACNSKLDEMLRKQTANFKAFMRAAANTQVEFISEKWEFQDALQTLQARWSAIDNLHWEIESELNGEQIATYEERYSRFEGQYIDLKKALNIKMWSGAYREKTTPKLDIPVFNGSYNQWISFRDLFLEAIHKNPCLSPAQKMQFLKGKVHGEAEKLIQHLRISSENYEVCWEILNHRYNNKRRIATAHLDTLFGLPNIQQQSATHIKRLHDVTWECLHAIDNIGVDRDTILVYLLSQKLDADTNSDYIESLQNARELPTLKEFLDYLEGKFTSLEASRRRQDNPPKNKPVIQHFSQTKKQFNNNYSDSNKKFAKSFHVSTFQCPLCNEEHGLYHCPRFLEMKNDQKIITVKKLRVCSNCLFSHNGNKCTSTKRCRNCQEKHNTLLHEAYCSNVNQTTTNSSHVSQEDSSSEILLATAIVNVEAADGVQYKMRALIDQGSQVSLITEQSAQLLGLKRQKCQGVVFGVGQKESNCKGMITISCSSIYNDFKFVTSTIIMNNLIKNLPNKTFTKPSWSHIQNIKLADPEFYNSRPVDILLGADIYSQIVLQGMIKGINIDQPIAQQSHLGWLLCGNVKTFQCNVILNNIDDMKKFWETEDIRDEQELSSEDQNCIDLYNKTTRRLQNGQYEVRLPMKREVESKLGLSKPMAIAQFKNLERKFENQRSLSCSYKAFMNEYIDLQHMFQSTIVATRECYLPHHGIQRAESTTTKYRVVFNASAKTSTGCSLNDLMYKGPNLQQDLQTLLIKWRQYKYAFTADIEKMYRQILVAPCDQQLQKIVWRETPEQPIKTYQLATVTYGTKAAPFLAMMTLRRLAEDEQTQYPNASKVLANSFYMDDLCHGSFTAQEGKQLISDLKELLKTGGFNLRKWSCNDQSLLSFEDKQYKQEDMVFNFKTEQTHKTLGLRWNPKDDTFSFQCPISEQNKENTKRSLLAEISKLFDPLGLLTPLSTKLKLLFQKIWETTLKWDDKVPDNIQKEWRKIQAEIKAINYCEIPRWLRCDGKQTIELHGFSDASMDAYACVIYARMQHTTQVVLVAAKSKIVPQRKVTTLPRLELNGTHILAKLMRKVKESLHQHNIQVYGWTDSMVVLGWLQGDPLRWKTYVENRVQQINDVIPRTNWSYVKSSENPADAASRGQYARQLQENHLWWQGPVWLSSFDENKHSTTKRLYCTNQEEKTTINLQANTAQTTVQTYDIIEQLLQKHSSINHIIRVVTWILRALNPSRRHLPTYLTLQELNAAIRVIVTQIQSKAFETDIHHLQRYGKLRSSSKLLSLDPFIDQEGILRVGGRLKYAMLREDVKHPIIIPHDCRLAYLLIDQAHQMTFHGGPRLTLSHLRQKYWITGGVRVTKMQIGKCVTCRKNSPIKQKQIMGNLPPSRTNIAPPFYHTGVDYTGFVDIKLNKGRGAKTTKGYIAVFICMVTKAVHIELVSDLSSASFLAALHRMVARRGSPCHIYSDNGTNFVGANRVLLEQYAEIEDTYKHEQIQTSIADMKIQWHFNAPAWPSAGGLWERAVRSLKHHLKRVVGEQKLTFEEFSTVLSKLEACLNSRPLWPLSENIEDLECLTPAHFLTGRCGITIIETKEDARTRWELTRNIFQEIWKKWKVEYLCQLQVRSKWQEPRQNINIGDMVVIHDDHLPPGKWLLGRVIDLHPGEDGFVRVVSLKTKTGCIKRPIIKLSVLPINSEQNMEQQQMNNESKNESLTCDTINKQTRQRQATTKKKGVNFLGLVMTLLYFVNYTSSTNITNTVDIEQSLYFDKLTNMQLIRDEWKIVVYYDVKPYWDGLTAFGKFDNHLENICSKLKQESQCDIISLQLHHAYADLLHYNRILRNVHGNVRTKRGLINGIGNIAHSLFGVLDDQFAEQYERDISLIKQNEKHLAQLARNQTSIIEAEYNFLKRSEETVSKQYKLFNQHLLQLDKTTNNVQKEINAQEMSIQFVLSAIAANSLIEHLRNIQETLLDTITNIYNGKMNLHIITPEQMRDELNIISGQLSQDLTLPINNVQQDYFHLYHLLNIKAKMTENYLIVEIKIPLISRDTYEIYKILPVPKRYEMDMVTLTPISEIIAINIAKDSYLSITALELQKCLPHDSTSLLCPLKTPIYRMKSDESLCEKNKEQTKCETHRERCRDTWTELSNTNKYLYFCCEQCKVHIICGHQVSTLLLRKAGVMTLADDCVIKSETFTLFAHKQRTTELQARVDAAPVDIPPINTMINLSMPILRNKPNNESENFAGEQKSLLKNLGKQVEQMKASTSEDFLSERVTYHDIHQYVVLYLLVAMAAVTALIYAYHRFCKRFTNSPTIEAPPVPIPRRRSTASMTENIVNDFPGNSRTPAPQLDKGTSPAARSEILN